MTATEGTLVGFPAAGATDAVGPHDADAAAVVAQATGRIQAGAPGHAHLRGPPPVPVGAPIGLGPRLGRCFDTRFATRSRRTLADAAAPVGTKDAHAAA